MKTVIIPHNFIYTGDLILINQRYPFREGIVDHLLEPVNKESNKILLERRATKHLSNIMRAIRGWEQIAAVSGWRSRHEQESIFYKSLEENGTAFTKQFVAKPGYSEHQTGLAIDLGLKQPDIDFIRPDFPYYGICQNFREKSILFGFIQRYPKGKDNITHIAHESWHFRYVGMPHAVIMKEMSLTLEEYLDFLKQFPYGQYSYNYHTEEQHIVISYIKATISADTRFEIDTKIPYSVSGNNMDGFVITEWRDKNVRG